MAKKKRDESDVTEEVRTQVQTAASHSEVIDGDSRDAKRKKKKNHKRKSDSNTSQVKDETPTVSIALPGSIVDNAQSLELTTRILTGIFFRYQLAGQIARATTIFRIDEYLLEEGSKVHYNLYFSQKEQE